MNAGQALAAKLVVAVLNRAFKLDPKAVTFLVELQVPCNNAIADDPHIVVSDSIMTTVGEQTTVPYLGIIGLLNGMIKAEHCFRIARHLDDDGNLVGFRTVLVVPKKG